MRTMAFLLVLLHPARIRDIAHGSYLGVSVPIGLIYVIWKLAVGFPKVLKAS
jgi:hypothetical protein